MRVRVGQSRVRAAMAALVVMAAVAEALLAMVAAVLEWAVLEWAAPEAMAVRSKRAAVHRAARGLEVLRVRIQMAAAIAARQVILGLPVGRSRRRSCSLVWRVDGSEMIAVLAPGNGSMAPRA